MRVQLGLMVVAASVFGCGLDEQVEETSELTQGAIIRCPDPDDCTLSNGGGTYTEELGFAGMGPNDFMILRFINNASGPVSIRGRQRDPVTNHWVASTQQVLHAYYPPMGGSTFPVMWVGETNTLPTFKLLGPNGWFPVTGDHILDLKVVIGVDGAQFTLSFVQSLQYGTTSATNPTPVNAYYMRWNPGKAYNASTSEPYCYRAPINDTYQATDPVVFQQGIGVNPITAVMSVDDSFTTLSCRYGAIATARYWGYPYRGTTAMTDVFEAAMHMKRASYCGDETFFTRANTWIQIRDTYSPPIQSSTLSPTNFEASWGRTPWGIRAKCVNWFQRRKMHALFPPPIMAPPGVMPEEYDGHCAVGPDIPDCADGAFGSLADEHVASP